VTPSAGHADTLVRALHAGIARDRVALTDVYTDDVRAWTPALFANSLTELTAEFERRDDAFSGIELEVAPLDVNGDYACAEWSVTMTHTGPLTVAEGMTIEPTGTRVTLHGVTIAEFRGERICALRQYWDELSVYEQLGLISGPAAETTRDE
jgi:ketosteroid isomerase-like protein